MKWRVTETRSETMIVEADSAEEAKMLAWMRTTLATPISLSVTHGATPEPDEREEDR